MQLAAISGPAVDARQSTLRQWAGAGAAIATAGAIVAAPGVNPVLPSLEHRVETAAVRLSAGWDPLAAWRDAFNTASGNASTLADNFFLAPGVGLQQAIVNQVGYLSELLNDPSSIGDVLGKIANNVQTVGSGVTLVNASDATYSAATAHTVDGLHGLIATLLPQFLSPNIDAGLVTNLLKVAASPLSGVLIGAIGPVVSPVVAFLNTVTTIVSALQVGDTTTALQELVDAPAHVVGSFFNGATLNLDALTPLLNSSGVFQNTTLNALNVSFGGLFSTGSVSAGPYTGPAGSINVPGGSILNSVGMNVTATLGGIPITLPIPGQAVGPLGALEGLSQTIGVLLGDGWDGKGAKQLPPLAGLHFPTLTDTTTPTTLSADALSVAADQATSDATATLSPASATTATTTDSASKKLTTTSPEKAAAGDVSTTSTSDAVASESDSATSVSSDGGDGRPETTKAATNTKTPATDSTTKASTTAASSTTSSQTTSSTTAGGNSAAGTSTVSSSKDTSTSSSGSTNSSSAGGQTAASKTGTTSSSGTSASTSTAAKHTSTAGDKSTGSAGGGNGE